MKIKVENGPSWGQGVTGESQRSSGEAQSAVSRPGGAPGGDIALSCSLPPHPVHNVTHLPHRRGCFPAHQLLQLQLLVFCGPVCGWTALPSLEGARAAPASQGQWLWADEKGGPSPKGAFFSISFPHPTLPDISPPFISAEPVFSHRVLHMLLVSGDCAPLWRHHQFPHWHWDLPLRNPRLLPGCLPARIPEAALCPEYPG